jgi:hypothetical protein
MIIDHRVYTIKPNRLNRFLETYERLALPVQRKYLGEPYVSLSRTSGRLTASCISGSTKASPTESSAVTPWRQTSSGRPTGAWRLKRTHSSTWKIRFSNRCRSSRPANGHLFGAAQMMLGL